MLPGCKCGVFGGFGEILVFEENPPEEEIQTTLTPELIDLIHDTNLLDLNSVGLSDEEIDVLVSQPEAKLAELEKEFLEIKTLIKNLETEIVEHQNERIELLEKELDLISKKDVE